MIKFDRLSSLISRFELIVQPTDSAIADLYVYANSNSNTPSRVILSPNSAIVPPLNADESVVFKADVEWGGQSNPLFQALPNVLELDLTQDPETAAITALLKTESDAKRCGSSSVLARLSEILIVRLMRVQIERGNLEVGLFGGLNDPRISRAIVSIHDNPAKAWTNLELANVAGLSLSRFSEVFTKIVQETPNGYLRRWRLILARQDVIAGKRVQDIALQYGYKSGEALSRAFHKQFGDTPTNIRKQFAKA